MNRDRAVRALDGLLLLLAAVLAGVLLTGGWTLPLAAARLPITRGEDVLLAALPVLGLRWWLRAPDLSGIAPRRVVACGVAAYAAAFAFISASRHSAFRTHALDLGYYVQIVWSITQGGGPHVSLPEMHAWGDHFSPILYLLAPLFAVFPGPVFLLMAQAVILAMGALAVFSIAARRLGDAQVAAVFAGLYLLNPSLHGTNVRDFHSASLAVPLFLAALACFEAKRPVLFLVALLLAISTREDAAIAVIGVGVWIAVRHRRWRWGVGVAVAGFGWLLGTVGWLMPYFRGSAYPHLRRFGHLGGSVGEILFTLVTQPFEALSYMLTVDRLTYLLALLAPLGFLPLLSPLDLLPALPTLVVNLQSRDPVLFHHRTQYTSFVLPFLVVAAISGYGRLREWVRNRAAGEGSAPMLRVPLALAVLLSLALTARTVNDLGVSKWRLSDRQRAAYAVMAKIPADAAVSAQERFVPHLALRARIYVFPTYLAKSEYVLIDMDTYPWRGAPDHTLERRDEAVILRAGAAEHRYAVVAEETRYLLLRRAGESPAAGVRPGTRREPG